VPSLKPALDERPLKNRPFTMCVQVHLKPPKVIVTVPLQALTCRGTLIDGAIHQMAPAHDPPCAHSSSAGSFV
jgi:hypothetical protein